MRIIVQLDLICGVCFTLLHETCKMIELSGHSSSWRGAREWEPSISVFLRTFLVQKSHMCCLWRSIVCERKEKEQLGWTPHKKLHSLRCKTSVPGQTLIAVSQTILAPCQYWSLLYLSHIFFSSFYLNSLTSFCCDLSFRVFDLELLLIFPISAFDWIPGAAENAKPGYLLCGMYIW